MPEVNVDQKQIEKLFFDLDDCITDVQKAIITINNGYRNLGADWKDAKYKELGKIVDSCTKELVKVRDEFSQAFEKMRQLYECILEYESVDLSNGNSSNFLGRLGQAASTVLNSNTVRLGVAAYQLSEALQGNPQRPPTDSPNISSEMLTAAGIQLRTMVEEHRILHQIRHGDMVSDFSEQDNPDHILIINSDD